MRVSYSRELQELPTTLGAVIRADVTALQQALQQVGSGPVRFVGTGGTLALARLAADLHEDTARQPARVMTPLEFVQAPRLARCGAVLFSARAKHPDALLALGEMTGGDYRPAVLVTHRAPSDIELAAITDLQVVQIPKPALREGFLATNSVLAMAGMLVRAHGVELADLTLDDITEFSQEVPVDRPNLLVLHPPRLAAVAIDIETRLAELGLCAVQVADLRNIAHGRHTGLARNAHSTTILTLSDRGSGEFAHAVTTILRDADAAHAEWHVDDGPQVATIKLLAASMHLTDRFANAQRVDPGRPSVPVFGRRLYNQPIRRLLCRPARNPVRRKADALGVGEVPALVHDDYGKAYDAWTRSLSSVAFGGIVLDYDGTVCLTSRRTEAPSAEIQTELTRLLDAGLVVGFASGRGQSLHSGLRTWIARHYWPQVVIGLYNGAVRQTLADDLADLREPSELIATAHARLQDSVLGHMVVLEPRSSQVTVQAATSHFHADRLAELVRDVLAQEPPLALKTVASGHSLDVIADDTSKVAVINDVRQLQVAEVLVIGDQGDMGGNDFEMLAATPWSISVDRCSADPSRCWPTDEHGRRGPAALHAVLQALRVSGGVAHLAMARSSVRHA